VLNNHGSEAISGVADFAHDRHLWPQISAGKLNNVTMPALGFEPADVRAAAIEVQRQRRRADGRGLSGSRGGQVWRRSGDQW